MKTPLCTAVVFLLLSGLAAAPAGAAFTECRPITAADVWKPPLTLEDPGVYCLVEDLEVALSSGTAIIVNSDDVTLDLNGHSLVNVDGPGGSYGISVNGDRIEVRGGKIAGFYIGLSSSCLEIGQGHRIEHLHIDRSAFIGAFLQCPNTLFRDNLVTRTGDDEQSYAYGVSISASAVHVVDNSVFQTSGRFLGAAISASSGSQEAMVLGNRITEAGRGVYGFGSSRPRCRDNVTSMVGVAYTGHTDLGNNH